MKIASNINNNNNENIGEYSIVVFSDDDDCSIR